MHVIYVGSRETTSQAKKRFCEEENVLIEDSDIVLLVIYDE